MSQARQLADVASGNTTERILSGRKNMIINGGFDVWQRGTSFTASGYTADRWFSFITGGSIARVGDSNTQNYIQATVNSGTDTVTLEQRLEFPVQYSNKTLTLSCDIFGVPSDSNSIKYEIAINHTGGRTALTTGSYGIGAGRKIVSFTVPDLSVYTLDSSSYLEVRPFAYVAEGTWTGAVGLRDIQLELGSQATDFEYRSYGEELALCQRYGLRLGEGGKRVAMGSAGSSTLGLLLVHPHTQFRVIPSLVINNIGNIVREGMAWYPVTSLSISSEASVNAVSLNYSLATSSLAGGDVCVGGNGMDIFLDAEL